jgi:hypothetical protein
MSATALRSTSKGQQTIYRLGDSSLIRFVQVSTGRAQLQYTGPRQAKPATDPAGLEALRGLHKVAKNALAIADQGVDADDQPFIRFAQPKGRALATLLGREQASEQQVLRMLLAVSRAARQASDNGIASLSILPELIFVRATTDDGANSVEIVLTDHFHNLCPDARVAQCLNQLPECGPQRGMAMLAWMGCAWLNNQPLAKASLPAQDQVTPATYKLLAALLDPNNSAGPGNWQALEQSILLVLAGGGLSHSEPSFIQWLHECFPRSEGLIRCLDIEPLPHTDWLRVWYYNAEARQWLIVYATATAGVATKRAVQQLEDSGLVEALGRCFVGQDERRKFIAIALAEPTCQPLLGLLTRPWSAAQAAAFALALIEQVEAAHEALGYWPDLMTVPVLVDRQQQPVLLPLPGDARTQDWYAGSQEWQIATLLARIAAAVFTGNAALLMNPKAVASGQDARLPEGLKIALKAQQQGKPAASLTIATVRNAVAVESQRQSQQASGLISRPTRSKQSLAKRTERKKVLLLLLLVLLFQVMVNAGIIVIFN